ncbi:hypothetical protein PSH79_20345 [Pseudomonas sp. FP2196]|uniref:hypothetical protein n=1 Tax=Pseudomonas sp. FP2196 TaxID=2954086 RepID=UPI0027347F47|nr:hypothetical protein [Pseudomonas sp. FP2196]WLH34267.1 hypothetical protein PSH79_20345 [Pseudomonas sp. FP2196]
MINDSDSLVFLKETRELAYDFDSCLKTAADFFVNSTTPTKKHKGALRSVAESFKVCLGNVHPVEPILLSWLNFLIAPGPVECIIPGFTTDWGKEQLVGVGSVKHQKNFLKVFFILLHRAGALLLPIDFSPPWAVWIENEAANGNIYTPLIEVFRKMRRDTLSYKQVSDSIKNRNGRTFQAGVRLILASTWYSPECISCTDLDAWAVFIRKRQQSLGTATFPLESIVKEVVSYFPKHVAESVKTWDGSLLSGINAERRQQEKINSIKVAVGSGGSAISVSRGIVDKIGNDAFFYFDNFRSMDLINAIGPSLHSIDLNLAFSTWASAFEFFLQHKELEKIKAYITTFGRLNFYLFIYLPLWIRENPASKFVYPQSPNLFMGLVHYRCQLESREGRPLSMTEFYTEVGWKKTYGMLSPLRVFFKILIQIPLMPGCDGIVQPIYWLPKSKKYPRVVKNIFPGEQLLLFVDFLNALESVSEWAAMNEMEFRIEFELAKKDNRLFSFENVGYVPVVLLDGVYRSIKNVHPLVFIFLDWQGRTYFNPGATRFSIFMLEVGTRAQTAQWLCSTSYNKVSFDVSNHPLQLVSLWLNTDKISKVPLIVITIMQMLWLLDSQVEWRNRMISAGVEAFGRQVYYDLNEESKWGLISPIFAHDPLTGVPFTDGTYAQFWAYQCYSFQDWVRSLGAEVPNIVALMPHKKNGGYFTWEDYGVAISSKELLERFARDVKIIEALPGAKIYVGDYCPLSLRCKVTAHGARASFVTAMSVTLCPEAIILLTGQSTGTVRKYNKGDYLIRRKLQGVFNSRDVAGTLDGVYRNVSLSKMVDDVKGELGADSPLGLQRLGFVSPSAAGVTYGSRTPTSLIASDKANSVQSCFSHICTKGFICPPAILEAFDGVKICPSCPHALFSIFHLPEISVARQKAVEDFVGLSNKVEAHRSEKNLTLDEMNFLTISLNQQARLAVAWLALEESIWSHICLLRDNSEFDLIAIDRSVALLDLERYEVDQDSPEFFFTRLSEVCMYEGSSSVEFQYKIEKATRLLLVKDQKLLEAAMMTSEYSTPVRLASMLRARLGTVAFDVDQFVSLVNMSNEEWASNLTIEFAKANRLTGLEGKDDKKK